VLSRLKVESATVVVLAICIFLSFYFTFLSFQATEDALKKQLVTFAAYFIISGVVILAILMIHIGIKKAFSRVEDQLKHSEEPLEHEKV
jgi:NADH:ubiquinone oxidoreductase subunit 6 (subunit J)